MDNFVMHPNSTFQRDFLFRYPAYCWATTWLQDQVWEGLQNLGQGEKSILDFLNNRNNVSAARAYAFEPHVFRTLENAGISGRLCRLAEDSVQELPSVRLTPLRRSTFVNLHDLSPESIGTREMFYILAHFEALLWQTLFWYFSFLHMLAHRTWSDERQGLDHGCLAYRRSHTVKFQAALNAGPI